MMLLWIFSRRKSRKRYFRRVVFPENLYRQNVGHGMQNDIADFYLNVAGRHVFIDALAHHNLAVNGNDAFHPDIFQLLKQIAGAVNYALGNAVVVAQIDKAQIA